MSPLAATVAANDPPLTARFSVRARAEPGVMPRLLELFAKRGLVPTEWHSVATNGDRTARAPAGLAPGELSIDIEMRGLGRETLDYIAACMRQIASVKTVLASVMPGGRIE